MAKYMEIAAESQGTIASLMSLIPEAKHAEAAVLIGHVFNYGYRCNPRPASSTIRINAVTKAMEQQPVKVRTKSKVLDSGKTINIIEITPIH